MLNKDGMLSKEEIDRLLCIDLLLSDDYNYQQLISFLCMGGIEFEINQKKEDIDFLELCKKIDVSKTTLVKEEEVPLGMQFLTQETYLKILNKLIEQLSKDEKPDFDNIYAELNITHLGWCYKPKI